MRSKRNGKHRLHRLERLASLLGIQGESELELWHFPLCAREAHSNLIPPRTDLHVPARTGELGYARTDFAKENSD